jgi:hypothetical protein
MEQGCDTTASRRRTDHFFEGDKPAEADRRQRRGETK